MPCATALVYGRRSDEFCAKKSLAVMRRSPILVRIKNICVWHMESSLVTPKIASREEKKTSLNRIDSLDSNESSSLILFLSLCTVCNCVSLLEWYFYYLFLLERLPISLSLSLSYTHTQTHSLSLSLLSTLYIYISLELYSTSSTILSISFYCCLRTILWNAQLISVPVHLSLSLSLSLCVCVYVYICVCVCVRVCGAFVCASLLCFCCLPARYSCCCSMKCVSQNVICTMLLTTHTWVHSIFR